MLIVVLVFYLVSYKEFFLLPSWLSTIYVELCKN